MGCLICVPGKVYGKTVKDILTRVLNHLYMRNKVALGRKDGVHPRFFHLDREWRVLEKNFACMDLEKEYDSL